MATKGIQAVAAGIYKQQAALDSTQFQEMRALIPTQQGRGVSDALLLKLTASKAK
jgi:hypothetical protein